MKTTGEDVMLTIFPSTVVAAVGTTASSSP